MFQVFTLNLIYNLTELVIIYLICKTWLAGKETKNKERKIELTQRIAGGIKLNN